MINQLLDFIKKEKKDCKQIWRLCARICIIFYPRWWCYFWYKSAGKCKCCVPHIKRDCIMLSGKNTGSIESCLWGALIVTCIEL